MKPACRKKGKSMLASVGDLTAIEDLDVRTPSRKGIARGKRRRRGVISTAGVQRGVREEKGQTRSQREEKMSNWSKRAEIRKRYPIPP